MKAKRNVLTCRYNTSNIKPTQNISNKQPEKLLLPNSSEYEYYLKSVYNPKYKTKSLSQKTSMKDLSCLSTRQKLNAYLDKQHQQKQQDLHNDPTKTTKDKCFNEWITKQLNGITQHKITKLINKVHSAQTSIDKNKWYKQIDTNQRTSIQIEQNILNKISSNNPYSIRYNKEEEQKTNEFITNHNKAFQKEILDTTKLNVEYKYKEHQNELNRVNDMLKINNNSKQHIVNRFNNNNERLKYDNCNRVLYHDIKVNDITFNNTNNKQYNVCNYIFPNNISTRSNSICGLGNDIKPVMKSFQFTRRKERKGYLVKTH